MKDKYLILRAIAFYLWSDKKLISKNKEIVEYKNLNVLREMIKPFTFFHYPKIKLNFFQHNVVLKDYTEYDNICKGVLTEKELEKLEGKK